MANMAPELSSTSMVLCRFVSGLTAILAASFWLMIEPRVNLRRAFLADDRAPRELAQGFAIMPFECSHHFVASHRYRLQATTFFMNIPAVVAITTGHQHWKPW